MNCNNYITNYINIYIFIFCRYPIAAPSKKCRQYSTEYLSYGFIPAPQNETKPMCLICMDVLSNDSMKLSKLKIHQEKKHIGKKDKPVEYFKKLRDDFQKEKRCLKCLLTK